MTEPLVARFSPLTDHGLAETALRQAAVAELGRTALAGAEPEELMEAAVVLVARTLGVEFVSVLERIDDPDGLLVRGGTGWKKGRVGSAVVHPDDGSLAGYTVMRGEPVVVSDLANETRFRPDASLSEHGIRSAAAVPMEGWGGAFGVLTAMTGEYRSFSDEEVHFLQNVGNVVASAIDRKRAETAVTEALEREEDARRRVEFLAEASGLLARSLDIETTLNTLTGLAVPYLGDWCVIHLAREDGSFQRLEVAHADPARTELVRELQTRFPDDPKGDHPRVRVLRTGQPEIVPEIADEHLRSAAVDDEHLRLLRELGLRSAMVVPLSAGGHTYGTLTLVSSEGGRLYDEADVVLAEDLAHRAALAVGNARLFREVEIAERELRFQKTLLESLAESTLDGVVIVSDEMKLLTFNRRFIEMSGLPQEIAERRDASEALRWATTQVVDAEGFTRSVAAITGDRESESSLEVRLIDGRIVDIHSAPVVGPDGVHYGRAWYVRDVTDRRRVEHDLRRSEGRLAFLSAVGPALQSMFPDHIAILEKVAELSVPELADWCAVDMPRDDGSVYRLIVTHADPSKAEVAAKLMRCPPDPRGRHPAMEVLRGERSAVMPEVSEEFLSRVARDAEHLDIMSRLGPRSWMSVPLKARGRTLAVLSLFATDESGRTFGNEDLLLAEELAYRAAIALDNALLYRERAEVARTLQASLLPPVLPDIPGLEVAARYHPASVPGADVGGDFYDVFDTGRDWWGVAVGDVCGKGTDAAVITALARHTLRTASLRSSKPAEVLSTLNEAILRGGLVDRFCTVAYVSVRPQRRRADLSVCCAGHPLPLVLRGEGSIESAGSPGTLLGMFDDPEFTTQEVQLGPGDVLVLYTDGVTEARGRTSVLGEGMLRYVLQTCAGQGAAEVAARVAETALEFQEGNPHDDIAVLAIGVPR